MHVPHIMRLCSIPIRDHGDVRAGLAMARELGLHFVVSPLALAGSRLGQAAEGTRGEVKPVPPMGPSAPSPFLQHDLFARNSSWASHVVGRASEAPGFSSVAAGNAGPLRAQAQLLRECSLAAHLALPAVVLPRPCPGPGLMPYVRAVSAAVAAHSGMQFWYRASAGPGPAAWAGWDQLRRACDHAPNLCVALELGPQLAEGSALERWLGEPVRGALVRTDRFVENSAGRPVLPGAHQAFVASLFKHGVQLVLAGPANQQAPPEPPRVSACLEYLHHVCTADSPFSDQELQERAFFDVVQQPLQPLRDNLENQLYETFEADAFKYRQYERACVGALRHLAATANDVHGRGDGPGGGQAVPGAAPGQRSVMVLGAGRGPLVSAALRAADEVGEEVHVFAVEKNDNAVVGLALRAGADPLWTNRVTVVHADMRSWQGPEGGRGADLIVSELLGSLGDNELSPECLLGSRHLLQPDGVCVPRAYESFLAPVTASKAWAQVRRLDVPGAPSAYEQVYVVRLHAHHQAAPAQRLFSFDHAALGPDMEVDVDVESSRYANVTFHVDTDTTIHGFAGYFEATLWESVAISTNPASRSEGMGSWFPAFLPLSQPVRLGPDLPPVSLHIWRCIDRAHTKVWYEWALSSPEPTAVANVGGRSSSMAL